MSGNSLSLVEIIQNPREKNLPLLSNKDLEFQEERKKRKVNKLDFEVR